jgi:tetratricopeptide (TPR) repeat protein
MRKAVVNFLKSLFSRQVVTAQTSAGSQSPVIAGVGGNVSVTSGVPEKVVDYLMERIRILEAGYNETQKRDFALNEKQKLFEELTEKYHELEKRLGEEAPQNKLVNQSRELLQQGKVEEAGKPLDDLIAEAGQNLASHHFSRAQLFDLQFRPLQALPHYQEACRLDPANSKYSFAYALLLQKQNDFSKAESLYLEVLKRHRQLAQDNPARLPARCGRHAEQPRDSLRCHAAAGAGGAGL